ncbi:MAG TPA: MarR family transcriptional regulator [Bacteroidia bacterium]|jgi:DNA-binding transcriptional regulator GbsR (MarR family)
MAKVALSKKQKVLIEKLGVFMESSGMPPVQARIASLLLACDKTELTFDEIQKTLMISKGAASTAINGLLIMERIQYTTKTGDRKRYFSSRLGQIETDFEKNSVKLLEINSILQEVLAARTKATKEFNSQLKLVIDFMEFLSHEMPGLYKKWRTIKKQS